MKKCRVCREPFEPRLPMQAVCGIDCARALAISVRGKAEKQAATKQRKADRERKEKLKTRRDWEKEAQAAFNAFIRARDADKPCICCGLPLAAGDVGGAYDCGHYRSVGSAPHLRYDERNAHAQRKQCNRWGAGRAVDYRLGLIERIGLVSIRARHCWRAMLSVPVGYLAHEMFQSAPAIAGGRCITSGSRTTGIGWKGLAKS